MEVKIRAEILNDTKKSSKNIVLFGAVFVVFQKLMAVFHRKMVLLRSCFSEEGIKSVLRPVDSVCYASSDYFYYQRKPQPWIVAQEDIQRIEELLNNY